MTRLEKGTETSNKRIISNKVGKREKQMIVNKFKKQSRIIKDYYGNSTGILDKIKDLKFGLWKW